MLSSTCKNKGLQCCGWWTKRFWSIKKNSIIHDNIQKIPTGQGDDYTTGCLLDYNYFNNHYKMIAMDLSKQQALDADPKANNKHLMFIQKQYSKLFLL